MRKLLSIFLTLFSLVAIQAQPPIGGECSADFTVAVSNFNAVFTGSVSLEDSTDFVIEWFWSFDQEVDISGQTASIELTPGTYPICLIVTTNNGCSAITCQDIVVNSDGTGGIDSTACYIWAGFFATTSGTTTAFNDFSSSGSAAGGGIASWAWDFGDGTTSTEQNPIHMYGEDGNYTVCLTVTDVNGCVDTNCQLISTANAPLDCITILDGSSPYAANDSIFLEVIAIDEYCCSGNWDGICQGLYDELSNGGGTDTLNCVAMFYHTAIDSTGGGIPIGNPGGLVVTFWDASWGAGSWSWDFGDNTFETGSQVTHTYSQSGIYTVCLTITNDTGCTDTYCEEIFVSDESFCFADFYYMPSQDGDDLTLVFEEWSSFGVNSWLWDFGDGATSTNPNPTHTYSEYGEYEICLTITTDDGCESTTCIHVFLWNPADCEAHFFTSAFPTDSLIIDPNFGSGLTAVFWDCSLGNPSSWTWDFGDGTTGTGLQTTHTYAMEGTYTVCLTITNGADCSDTTCQHIYVSESTWDVCYADFFVYPLDSTGTNSGNVFQFEDWSSQDVVAWQWDFGDGSSANEQNPIHTYTPDGIYTACLTTVTADGCVNTMCQSILVGDGGWEPTGFSLCGSINLSNNLNAPITYDATVYLIEYDAENGTLAAIDSTIAIGFGWGQDDSSSFSFYCFDGLEEGNYLVKAAMNPWSPLYENYLPTYYDGVLSWMNATTVAVEVNSDLFGIDINMVAGENPGGPGFIGGNISDGAGKSLSELGGIMVILLNEEGNPVGFTHTDEDGNYSFENIAYGTYTVHIEILNIPSEPYTVTISPNTPDVHDANFVMEDGGVSADFSSSIEDLILIGINDFMVSPNPIQSQTVVRFNADKSMAAELSIFNVMGQQVHQENLVIKAGANAFEVNASSLANGVYLLHLSQNGQPVYQVKVVKQ